MAATMSTVRLSIICLFFGLVIPILHSLHWQEILHLQGSLEHFAARCAVWPTQPSLAPSEVIPISQRGTPEASRLAEALRSDKGKWDINHPRRRLLEGLKGYQLYGEGRRTELNGWRAKFKKISPSQRQLIDTTIDYSGKLNKVEALMAGNAQISEAILNHGLQFYNISRKELDDFSRETKNGTSNQKTTVMYALKHIIRDWTDEGLHDRQPTFPCVLAALQKEFSAVTRVDVNPSVLVPGAALGRLAHEIAALADFNVISNEWSAAMNLAYRWMMSIRATNASVIYPNVDWWSHRATTASLTKEVAFPDDVELLQELDRVDLAEGDFTTVLRHYNGSFDAIVTHFFIDTARNIVAYLETIRDLLRPGGIWINFGPLLYGSNPSVQLSLDEVLAMAEALGLAIEEPGDGCGVPTTADPRLRSKLVPYNADPESLSRNAYLAQHWVARKKR